MERSDCRFDEIWFDFFFPFCFKDKGMSKIISRWWCVLWSRGMKYLFHMLRTVKNYKLVIFYHSFFYCLKEILCHLLMQYFSLYRKSKINAAFSPLPSLLFCSLPVFKIMNWFSSILQRWPIHVLKVLLRIHDLKHICSFKWFKPSHTRIVSW